MSKNDFRWRVIGLFIVVVVTIGLLEFLVWNQRVVPEPVGMDDSSIKMRAANHELIRDEPASAGELGQTKATSNGAERFDDELTDKKKICQVDTAASRIYVKVGSATRLGHPHGVEGKLKSGKIEWGAGGELVFDMSSFKADTKEARQKVGLEGKNLNENEAKKVTKTMLSADALDVEKFPVATYKIILIKPAERQDPGAPGAYEVNGRFLLHGADNQVKFKAKLERADKQGTFKLSGSFAIKQTDFGITPYSAVGGLVRVADQLEIFGELLLSPAK